MLFGNLLRNDLRKTAQEFHQTHGREALRQLAEDTRRSLLEQTLTDDTLASLHLASLARTIPHSWVLFLAIDAANIALMNPAQTPDHPALMAHISSKSGQPVALAMACLERL